MEFISAQDTINGTSGTVVATIEGQVHELAYIKEFEARIDLNKQSVHVLGSLAEHEKVTGYKGTGTMTIHYITSMYRRMVINYMKTGRLPMFSLVGTNDDPQSSVGVQSVALKNVLIDGSVLFKLNSDQSILDEDVSFTFTDADLLDEFGQPVAVV